MTGSDPSPSPLAVFRGPAVCRRTADGLTLTGAAADPADGRLILTLTASTAADLPASLTDAAIAALDEHRWRISSSSGSWDIEAVSVHVHRDIGEAFRRAIPPRSAPLKKRLFWAVALALAGTRAGKRLLLALRRRS